MRSVTKDGPVRLGDKSTTAKATIDDRSLGVYSAAEGISVQDKIALDEARTRKWVAIAIVTAFIFVNGAVLWGIWQVFLTDIDLLTRSGSAFKASDRIVTTNLLISLVSATTVQLGALIVLIGKYLFPAPKNRG